MSNPKFSVVMPVYSELEPLQSGASGQRHFRGKTAQRAIKSIRAQQFPDWELIIVDDGCVDNITPDILDQFAEHDDRIKVIHKANENRCIARNTGMDAATGEWICWLDSDDEYSSHYLRELDQATKDFPSYKLFNFASIIYYADHKSEIRPAFKPELNATKTGHEWFRAGHIACGSFIFKRELWASKKKYRIPDEINPFQFAALTKIPMKFDSEKDEFFWKNCPNPKTCFQDGEYRQGVSLGNPWGDDYAQWYFLTRDNISKPLDVALYIQYPRTNEDNYEYFGELFPAGLET